MPSRHEHRHLVSGEKKFAYKDLIKWEQSVYMYFESVSNSNNIPLVYVIHKDLNGVATKLINIERLEEEES